MLSLLFLLYSASVAVAGVQHVWWNITYVDDVNPDGLSPRRVIGVNGTWPPPPIFVQNTDDLVVHATNSLDQPTSLHHHGMLFNSTPWYDGAVGITQCGIPPGQSLDYFIPVTTDGIWGSYWVHSHYSGQYTDGLRAPLIIHPQQEAHNYDAEFTVVISDWYHERYEVLMRQFLNVDNPNGIEPVPDAPLIYFADQNYTYISPIQSAAAHVYPTTSHVGFNQNATLPFQAGRTYRLRIINTSTFAGFYFWIDGHDMKIIEVDGTDVEEAPIDNILITAAQRYSVLVQARNDSYPKNWAIHANMDVAMFDVLPSTLNPNATASITYSTGADLVNLSPMPEDFYHVTNDTAFVPVVVEAQLPPPTRRVELVTLLGLMTDGTNHGMFNGITFNMPIVPSLFTEVEFASQNISQDAYGTLAFLLNHLDVVDIVLRNEDTGKHPFHIHGHKYQIVHRASNYTSDDPTLNPPMIEGQVNPIRRDTVQVPAGGSVTIRFVADNPGAWFFHCHINWHLSTGLAAVFIEAPPLLSQTSIPGVLTNQCKTLGLPAQGNAAGNSDPSNLAGIPTGPFQQRSGWTPRGIGAMFGCILAATLGMATVTWYAIGSPGVNEKEIEEEIKRKRAQKATRSAWFRSASGK